jgi:RND superfamily putative drug exporter
MELLGKANWWFPAWLDRIVPRLSVEVAVEEPPILERIADDQRAPEPVARG